MKFYLYTWEKVIYRLVLCLCVVPIAGFAVEHKKHENASLRGGVSTIALRDGIDEVLEKQDSLQSRLNKCCVTLSTKIDELARDVQTDYAQTAYAIDKVDSKVGSVSTQIDQCCSKLSNKTDALQSSADEVLALDSNTYML